MGHAVDDAKEIFFKDTNFWTAIRKVITLWSGAQINENLEKHNKYVKDIEEWMSRPLSPSMVELSKFIAMLSVSGDAQKFFDLKLKLKRADGGGRGSYVSFFEHPESKSILYGASIYESYQSEFSDPESMDSIWCLDYDRELDDLDEDDPFDDLKTPELIIMSLTVEGFIFDRVVGGYSSKSPGCYNVSGLCFGDDEVQKADELLNKIFGDRVKIFERELWGKGDTLIVKTFSTGGGWCYNIVDLDTKQDEPCKHVDQEFLKIIGLLA